MDLQKRIGLLSDSASLAGTYDTLTIEPGAFMDLRELPRNLLNNRLSSWFDTSASALARFTKTPRSLSALPAEILLHIYKCVDDFATIKSLNCTSRYLCAIWRSNTYPILVALIANGGLLPLKYITMIHNRATELGTLGDIV